MTYGWWLVGGILFAVYMASCWWNPFTWCRSCHGKGRKQAGRNWRPCGWCKGTRHRRRWGARVMGRGE